MAEKSDKPSGSPYKIDTPIEFFVVGVLILGLLSSATVWVEKNKDTILSIYESIKYDLVNYFAKFAIFSGFFSLAGVIILSIYVYKTQKKREEIISRVIELEEEKEVEYDTKKENPKWQVVMDNINSEDPSKWRFAILEADIILSELLDALNLPGDNIGDKLKAVEASDFETIEEAWEAHKIRNAIAHEGSEFLLSQREARRVIDLFAKVFEEFEVI